MAKTMMEPRVLRPDSSIFMAIDAIMEEPVEKILKYCRLSLANGAFGGAASSPKCPITLARGAGLIVIPDVFDAFAAVALHRFCHID